MRKISRGLSTQCGRGRRASAFFAAIAGAALVLTACATPGSVSAGGPGTTHPSTQPATPVSTAPADSQQSPLLPKGNYQARDDQQSTVCDGVPAVPADKLVLLRAGAPISSAVICSETARYLPGKGIWSVSKATVVNAEELSRLLAALTAPDVVPNDDTMCTAQMVMVPGFVLTLPDGTRIRPGVPGDGCHPQRAVTDLLSTFVEADSTQTQSTPVEQVSSELEVITGCSSSASAPWVWLHAAGSALSSVPASGEVSVCRYTPQAHDDQQGKRVAGDSNVAFGELTHAGIVAAAAANGLLDASDTPAAGCAPVGKANEATGGDWVDIVVTSGKPAAPIFSPNPDVAIVALVELDGCRRWIASNTGLVGYLTADQTAALAALADKAAH